MNRVKQGVMQVLCLCTALVTMSDSRFLQPQAYHEQTRTFQRPNTNQQRLEALYRNRHDRMTQPSQRQSFTAITNAALQKIKSENRDSQLIGILRNSDGLRTSYNSLKQQNQIPTQRHKININLSNTRHSEDISKPQQRTISINAKIGRNFNFSHRYKGTNIRLQKNGQNTNIFISAPPHASAHHVPSGKHSSSSVQTKEDPQPMIRPDSNLHQNSPPHALDNEKNRLPTDRLELSQTRQLEQQLTAHQQAAQMLSAAHQQAVQELSAANRQAAQWLSAAHQQAAQGLSAAQQQAVQGLTTGVFDVVTLPAVASKTGTKIPSLQPQSPSLAAAAATASPLDPMDTSIFLSTLATPAQSGVSFTTSVDSHTKRTQDSSITAAVKPQGTILSSSSKSVQISQVTTASPKVTSPSLRDVTTEEIDLPDAGELPDLPDDAISSKQFSIPRFYSYFDK